MIVRAVAGGVPHSLRKHQRLRTDYREATAVSAKAAEGAKS